MSEAAVHYLPEREDGRDTGSSPTFTRNPQLVTCSTCLEHLTPPPAASCVCHGVCEAETPHGCRYCRTADPELPCPNIDGGV